MALKIIIILISLLNAGYMAFDGGRALMTGDYIRPTDGDYAGQLGPWTNIATAIGIDPMSNLMKITFLIIGIYGIIATLCFAFNIRSGWKLLLVFAILSVWNLTFGTVSSVLVMILLMVWKRKYVHAKS